MNQEQWKKRLTDEWCNLQSACNTCKTDVQLIQQLSRQYNDSCSEYLQDKTKTRMVYCIICSEINNTNNSFVRNIYDTFEKAKAQELYLDSIPSHKKDYVVFISTKEVQ